MTGTESRQGAKPGGLSSQPKRDRWTLTYLLWCLAVFGLVWYGNELDRIFNLYVFLVPIILLPLLVLSGCLLVGLIVATYRRHFRSVLSIVLAPSIGICVFVGLSKSGVTPEWIRFEFQKSKYLSQVSQIQTPGVPRFKTWNWGGTGGAAVSNIFYTLIYDETDQILLPSAKRSSDWKQRIDGIAKGNELFSIVTTEQNQENTGADDHGVSTTHLDGHFYLVTEVM